MGLELKGGNACLMPLVREDLIMPEQVRFARSCLNFPRRWFLVLELPNGILAREFIIPEGGVLAKIAQNQTNGLHWKFLARINGISSPTRIRSGQRLKLLDGPFHAVVDKSAYRLDLWMGQEDDRVYVRSFDVGLGRDNRTPEGKFQVSSRVENPQHTDPETGKIFDKDDPLNPVGEHWIAIKGIEPTTEKLSGFGLHGTIEENSIGRSESLGCVRMLPEDIALAVRSPEPLAAPKSNSAPNLRWSISATRQTDCGLHAMEAQKDGRPERVAFWIRLRVLNRLSKDKSGTTSDSEAELQL